MKWRIAANGVALVVAISSVAYASGETSVAAKPQKFVANDAKSVLASIKVENEYKSGYRRSLFVHWSDLDGNGCDTREDVLKRDSISKPQVDPYRCYVVAGDWYSKYDGKTLSDRSDVDIDHVVALKEAWDSGAWAWSMSQRQAFANDLTDRRTLIAVSDRVNASKSDKDPSNWMPPLKSYWCTYLSDWISVKARWGLSMDQSEFGRIKNLLASDCSTLTIAGWGAVPSLAGVPATSGTPATTATTTPRTTVAPSLSPTTSSNNSGTAATTNTTAVANSTVNTTSPSGVKDIYPGSYCAPVDGLGTYKGTVYVCSKTNAEGSPYAGGRARWRKATN
ncbi:MAG: HNH endonuclease family protein [Acidimicrobiaceae bacterium]